LLRGHGGRADRKHELDPGRTATATSRSALSASQITARPDPGLADVVSTDGDQDATSAGTGIVLTSNGLVLTNNHVIEGATSIKVTDIGNSTTYTAEVVGYDATQDVAVIRLENASGLTTASLGDSSTVQTGDSVVALNQSIAASDELSDVSEQLAGLPIDAALSIAKQIEAGTTTSDIHSGATLDPRPPTPA
jgi:S1-C subfamily serine protease